MNTRRITFTAVVAALYASLTLVGFSAAFGPIQFRFAEVLCILPFFFPFTTLGLFLGCLIANLLSPYGLLDIVAGSLASLIAAVLTMQIGKINRDSISTKALACFPPVIVNAVIIGAVIAWSTMARGAEFWFSAAVFGMQVGLGQLVVLYCIGLPLMVYLPKTRFFAYLSDIEGSGIY
ncbi:MAG: QueT transporter family protein [Oscillospiraceae bacterium]|nr:QueT transporter family protein [Oscillospiraceae bacterium]